MKVVEFDKKEQEQHKERAKLIAEQLDGIKKAFEEGRIHQFVLAYDEILEEPHEETGAETARHLIFWHEEDDLDTVIGFTDRIAWRMKAIAEAGE